MRLALRLAALSIAVGALADPRVEVERAGPVPVAFHAAASPADPDAAIARRIQADILAMSGRRIEQRDDAPAAIVAIGGQPEIDDIDGSVPVSTVSLAPAAPNARLLETSVPRLALAGQQLIVQVSLDAVGLAGTSSIVALERDGIELARAAQKWTGERERARVELPFVPTGPGVARLRVRVQTAGTETTDADNAADVAVPVVAGAVRVLTYEPRPAWAVAFVRRALESDPAFTVASIVRRSRGFEARAGDAPPALTPSALAAFDAVVIGAPEELTAAEVGALSAFAEARGGAVVFLPDRRPSGPFTRLLPASAYDEVLLDMPAALDGSGLRGLRASELSLPRTLARGTVALATVTRGTARALVTAAPLGDGVVVVSGALDAWRFRGQDEGAFDRAWRGVIASVALGSPPPLSVQVEPALAAPGDPVIVRARLRATELARQGSRTIVPAVTTTMTDGDGRGRDVRLWPSVREGEYVGVITAPMVGVYDVRVAAGDRRAADAVLVVAGDARTRERREVPASLAAATGGIATDARHLESLARHLSTLERPLERRSVHPMRSSWWIVPFAAALCGEWVLRRRKGLR